MSGDPSRAVHGSVTAVGEDEWDALVGENVLASHGWLRTVESTAVAPLRPRYVVIRSGERLVAAAVGYHVAPTETIETLDHLILGRLRPGLSRLGVSFSPVFVCCPLQAYGAHFLVAPDLDATTQDSLRESLLDGVEAEAAREGVGSAFLNLLATETEGLALLRRRGYLFGRDVPLNVLELRWPSFDEYLRHLDTVSRDARKDIRRQVNQNRKRGVVVDRLDDVGPHSARLHELLDRNSRKHNGAPFSYGSGFFAALQSNLGGGAAFYVARKEGTITAVSVVLRRGANAVAPMVGVDHALAGKDFTYFNVAHYRPIGDAIATGVERMMFGRALYELKARRGCELVDTVTAFRPARAWQKAVLLLWLPLLSAWNRAKLPAGVRYVSGGRFSLRQR